MTRHNKNYTDEEFIDAVNSSISRAEVFRKIGIKATGGNYKTFKIRAKKLEVSTDHLLGQAHLKGKKHNWNKKIPLEEILVRDSSYSSTQMLKQRLIRAGILIERCSTCGIGPKWFGNKLSLQLDHINSDNTDHRIENLRLLCPNCHSQTPGFAGRGKRGTKNITRQIKQLRFDFHSSKKKKRKKKKCFGCNQEFIATKKRIKFCSFKCYANSQRKVKRPSKEELQEMIDTMSWCAIGRQCGVSDNAVRKWAKSYNLL